MIEIWIRLLLLLPRPIRFWAYAATMRHYVRLSDEGLKRVVTHLMHSAVDLPGDKSDAFTEMRIEGCLRVPQKEAMRHIRFALPEIASKEFKKSAKIHAAIQRAVLRLPTEEQKRLADLLEPFGALEFFPVSISLERGVAAPTEAVWTAPSGPATPMSYDELKQLMASGKAFKLVEVLTPENYTLGHIPGAINIPAEQIDTAVDRLKKDEMIVVYCRDKNCQLSPRSAEYLVKELGFTNVHHFGGGKLEWVQRGEPLEKGPGGV